MEQKKRYSVFLPFLLILISVFLTSCDGQEASTVYRMEKQEDDSEILYIDDVQYRRDWNGNELAMYYNGGDVWTLTEDLGEQIGVYGPEADSGGGFAIYEVAGDEEQTVLYTKPRKFYFGGRDARLWLREDVSLGLPTVEMVSYITITCDQNEDIQTQTDDQGLIESLLDAYCSESDQSVEFPTADEQWIRYTLTLHHKDYPFLQYEITGGYSLDQNMAYCRNDDLEWFVLPEEWGNVLPKTMNYTSTSTQEETQAVQNTGENAKKSWNGYAHTPSEKLTPINTEIQLDGNTLSYGKIKMTLPDGVTMEEQKAENDTRVIDLIGMEKSENGPFPPRIWLLHYRIEYQDKWELASTLLDILPDTTLRYYDKLGDNLNYLFTYDKPCKNGYVMVYEDDIYIVEEISPESNYSFGELLAGDMIHWENSIQKIDVRNDNMIHYANFCKIKAEKNCTLMAMQSADKNGTQEISLFQGGCFTAPIMKFSFAECFSNIEFEDYNFDGCPDMIAAGTKIYLWNVDKKVYEAAQIPEDFPWWFGGRTLYPETQTIWGYEREYVEDEDGKMSWDMFDHTEMFWKWEGTALVKKRECVAEVREEGARILAYEDNPEKILFDDTFTAKEWDENSTEVQKRYQQFYAGMVPEEGGRNLHKIDNNQEYIPQALLDKIKKAMLNGAETETLREFQNDKELTNEEILTIAKDNLEMRSDVAAAKRYGDYIMVAADVDNDGIMDLIGEEYYDDYGCFMECAFYKGRRDGTFQKTHSHFLETEQFDVLSYDGKNYLCQTLNEHNGKKNMSFECYVDGIMTEVVNLTFFPERYDIHLAECAENKYKKLAEDILNNAISYKEKTDKGKNIDGAGEEKTPAGRYEYQCDLNNDEALEQYNKSVWMKRDLVYLDFFGKGTGIEPFYETVQSVEGIDVMMWVEPFAKRNIINILSLKEWENFEITGFLIQGTEYKQLYRITADAVVGVRQERCAYPPVK